MHCNMADIERITCTFIYQLLLSGFYIKQLKGDDNSCRQEYKHVTYFGNCSYKLPNASNGHKQM